MNGNLMMIAMITPRTMVSATREKGKTMLTSDGYCLTYYKNRNQIVIGLPQTFATATNTYEQVADRRVDVEESELWAVLLMVKMIFGERKDDEVE